MSTVPCEESEKEVRDLINAAFSNEAFVVVKTHASDTHSKELQRESTSNQGKHYQQVQTPVALHSSGDKRLLAKLRRQAWLLPLIYTHFWASAAFTLMQPFFPPLVSDETV